MKKDVGPNSYDEVFHKGVAKGFELGWYSALQEITKSLEVLEAKHASLFDKLVMQVSEGGNGCSCDREQI